MKKSIVIFLLMFLSSVLFADVYKIRQVNYKINGSDWKIMAKTKEYALDQKVPVDKNKLFSTEEKVKEYISDYKLKLESLRAFDTINITYNIEPYEVSEDSTFEIDGKMIGILPNEDGKCIINLVDITVEAQDSFHLLVVPYPKYNSNTGTEIKLKAKDTNFLGTLNEMSSDLNFAIEQKSETDKPDYKLGINFIYDYPFKIKDLDFTWCNNYNISYTFGNDLPEWNAKTGLKFQIPINSLALEFSVFQYAVNNFDYKEFGDSIYFTEEAEISLPVKLFEVKDFGYVTYTPYIDYSFNWDKDGINKLNTDLSGPIIKLGHKISGSRINWHGNFRTGFSAEISNSFTYNFQRQLLYPYIAAESKVYKHLPFNENNWFNAMGICADLYTFYYINNYKNEYFKYDGNNIGSRLRGIRDEQYYAVSGNGKACKVPAAIVFSFDAPFHIFTTNFLKVLDFSLQLSPFVDMALTYNKVTEQWFNFKDGFYTAGLEMLVYPLKWKGITVRASLGYDVGRKFFKNLNTEWRSNDISKYEISFGVGLQY